VLTRLNIKSNAWYVGLNVVLLCSIVQHAFLYVHCSSPSWTGVPQGSVLGPILFLLNAPDVLQSIKGHQTTSAYADDSQIYGFCRPLETVSL